MVGLLADAGLEPYSYSGRAMLGARCVAFDLDDPTQLPAQVVSVCRQVLESGVDLEAENWDELLEVMERVFRGARTDYMGSGVVVYFPDLAWTREEQRAWERGNGCYLEDGGGDKR